MKISRPGQHTGSCCVDKSGRVEEKENAVRTNTAVGDWFIDPKKKKGGKKREEDTSGRARRRDDNLCHRRGPAGEKGLEIIRRSTAILARKPRKWIVTVPRR